MGTIFVTMIYIYKHDSRINPGNRYEDIFRGTSVKIVYVIDTNVTDDEYSRYVSRRDNKRVKSALQISVWKKFLKFFSMWIYL